jgi:hypothetical protein
VVVSDVRADIHAVTTNGVLNSLTSNGVLNGLTSNGVLNGLTSNFLIPNGYLYNGVLNGLANNSLIGNGVLNGILIGGNFTDLFFQNETWNGLGYEIPNVVINGTQNLTGLVPPASILSGLTLDYIKYILSSVEVPQNSTEILPYLVTCALAPQDTFDFIINNVSHHYTGFLGLASTYYRLPLTREQEEILSACLFAHVNALGKHVFISLRNIPYVPATLEEMTDHRVYEGAFFGNLFGNDFIAYTCTGDKEVDALKNSPTRFLRLCTTNMTCNFKSVGNCSDACSNYTSNYGYSQCKGLDGRDYVPMNVYLESNDVTTNSQTFSLSTIIGIGVALGIVFVFFLITIVFIIVNRHKLFKRNNEK